jgi:hypothetical protein
LATAGELHEQMWRCGERRYAQVAELLTPR